ncbi:FHA domain-containing protein [Aphelenchoides bicaudatus]|nr:FHA domain-containing protein [Aphelenchoides bicaudatus]
MAEQFDIPKWVTKPPSGTHLDVAKNDSVIQKLLIDEKPAYYFGRNPKECDFIVEHASSSRCHGLLLYHSSLKKFALVDLKSSHGSFVRGVKITPLQPVFLEINDDFSFGASTRKYIIRSKLDVSADGMSSTSKDDVNLPEKEYELDNLTNYNTMNNRRIQAIPITIEEARRKSRPRNNVVFLEQEEVINPEDVDDTVGRFRNLVQTAIVSGGKRKGSQPADEGAKAVKRRILLPGKEDLDNSSTRPYSSLLGVGGISAAPSLDLYSNVSPAIGPTPKSMASADADDGSSKKKKYVKEAWPGRKTHSTAI